MTVFRRLAMGTGLALALVMVLGGSVSAQGIRSDFWDGIQAPLSTIVDSAALVRAVSTLPEPLLPERIQPLFHIMFDSTGAPKMVDPVFFQIPPAYADPVSAAILAHLRPQAPFRSRSMPRHLYLRVVAGPAPRVDRPAVAFEPLRLTTPRELRQGLQRLAERGHRGGMFRGRRAFRIYVSARIRANGSVDAGSVELEPSTTGAAAMDQEIAGLFSRMRFRPTVIDGVPVGSWVSLPVVFHPE